MLKGSYTKYFKFQSLVTVDDLHRIDRYLHSRCDKVIYNFETSDGVNYDADVIEDIIGYSNPSNAKIEKVTMIAQNNGKYSAHNHIIVKFYNRGRWDSSASLYISDANSDEIAAISKDLGIIGIAEIVLGLFLQGEITGKNGKPVSEACLARNFEQLFNLKFGSIYDKIGEVFTRKPYNLTKTLDALRNAIVREDRKRKNK